MDDDVKNDGSLHEQQYSVFPLSIFVKRMAIAFACTKCENVPSNAFHKSDGNLVCEQCSQTLNEKTTQANGVQMMINNLEITCANNRTNKTISNEEKEGSNNNLLIETGSPNLLKKEDTNDSHCEWSGKVKEFDFHNNNECECAQISCDYCSTHSCIRKLMKIHLITDCPQFIVECPLHCNQQSLKRCDIEHHLSNDCSKYLLACENIGCNLGIKRKNYEKHVKEECDYRLVSCPYVKYGCANNNGSNNLPFCELGQHMIDKKMNHIALQLDCMVNQAVDTQNSNVINIAMITQKFDEEKLKMRKENDSQNMRMFTMHEEQTIINVNQAQSISHLKTKLLKCERENVNQAQSISHLKTKLLKCERENQNLTQSNQNYKQQISALGNAITKLRDMPDKKIAIKIGMILY